MSIVENARLIEQFEAVWTSHDANAMLAIVADEIVWEDVAMPGPLRGKSAVRQYVEGWFTAFPDMVGQSRNHVITEDQAAGESGFVGTNTGPMQLAPGAPAIPPTGRRVN